MSFTKPFCLLLVMRAGQTSRMKTVLSLCLHTSMAVHSLETLFDLLDLIVFGLAKNYLMVHFSPSYNHSVFDQKTIKLELCFQEKSQH